MNTFDNTDDDIWWKNVDDSDVKIDSDESNQMGGRLRNMIINISLMEGGI